MISKLIKKDNYNLHVYKTDKFKTIQLNVVLSFETNEDNYLLSALLELMTIKSKYYPTRRERLLKQEDLYDEGFGIDLNKMGRLTTMEFCIDFINPKLVKDDYTEEAIKFLFDIINNPLFDESELTKIKDKIKQKYDSMLEHPDRYSRRRANETFFDNPLDRIPFIVDEETIDSITMEQIKNKYEDLINNSNVDIFLLGDVEDSYADYIDKYNKFISVNKSVDYIICTDVRKKVKKEVEIKKDINQAQVYIMYNVLNVDTRLRFSMAIFNMILSTGFASRLHSIVREKYKLCYDIKSSFYYTENYLSIYTGVDKDNIDKAIEAIKECVDGMNSITDKELEDYKVRVYSSLTAIFDSLDTIYSRDYNEYFTNRPSIEEEKKIVDSFGTKDIIDMVNHIKLNSIYILKGE